MDKAVKLNLRKVEYAARKFHLVTHPARLQIITMLEETEYMNTAEIQRRLDMKQSEISGHLSLLRNYGIIKRIRDGKTWYYSINLDSIKDIVKVSHKLYKHRPD